MLFEPVQLPLAQRPLRDLPPSARPKTPWRPPVGPLDLTGVKRLAVDVERRDPDLNKLGPGTFRGTAKIVGLALGTDDGRRAYYPVAHAGGGNCEWDVWDWARSALNAFDGEVVGAHLLYDLEALAWEERITFDRAKSFHDVQVAEAVIDEWRQRYALDELMLDYLGEGKVEGHLREVAQLYGWRTNAEVKANLWRLPGTDVGEYGEGDVDGPLRLLPLQLARLEADDQLGVYDLERRLIPVLLAMRLRGVRVASTDRIEEVRARLLAERDRWAAEVKRLLGPKAELNSSESLGQGLADRGLPVPRTAPSRHAPQGKWSVTKELLEKHAGDAAVNAIAAGRRVGTLVNLTLDSLLEHRTRAGRVHCEYNQLKGEDENGKLRGTIARLSASNPNLTQIPSRQSEFDGLLFDGGFDVTPEIRGLFLPEEGEVWESLDESQVEYRLNVAYAVGRGAEEARELYRNDPRTDYHKLAAELLRVDPEDKKRRKRVKNTNFAYAYGARARKLAITFNCSLEEAERFVKEYERALPFVSETYDTAARWAEKRGFVTTILGRKCRFPLWEPAGNFRGQQGYVNPLPYERALDAWPRRRLVRANTYKALNRKLQGSGADVLKLAMVEAHEAGLTAGDALGALLLTVHDEVDASRPFTPRGEEAIVELKRIMETCVELPGGVPLLVPREAGPSWGEVEPC